jgi:hypothetical protein
MLYPVAFLLIDGCRCLRDLTHLLLFLLLQAGNEPVRDNRYLTVANVLRFSELCEHRHVIGWDLHETTREH